MPRAEEAGEWQDVQCRDHPHSEYWTEEILTEDGTGKPTPEAEVAIRGCNRCPVQQKCLDVAMEFESGFGIHRSGIWGGVLPRDRERLHKLMLRRSA